MEKGRRKKFEIEIPFILGDGIGPEVFSVAREIIDFAVEKVYGVGKGIKWVEILAGQKALNEMGELLPEETVDRIRRCGVGIKGPLTTPVGGGYRSLNVTLRQVLDLYACVRPVKYVPGLPSPLRGPDGIDLVIFRENSEDVYAGIEWECNSEESIRMKDFLRENFGLELRPDSGLGLKPISRFATRRIVKKAIEYAVKNGRRRITIVHKGNIMKYTEGAFRNWAYEVFEEELGVCGEQNIVVDDVIADDMFQRLVLRPQEFDVVVTANLNGDYLSDAAAALIGGVGLTAGVNLSDKVAVFEPVHGTAPDIAGKALANPTAMIMAGVMMLEYIGFHGAGEVVRKAIEEVLKTGKVTRDIALLMGQDKYLSTREFGEEILRVIDEEAV